MKRLGKCRESRFAEPLYNDSSACDVVRCLPAVQNGVCPYKVEPCSGVLQNAGLPTSTAAGIDVNHLISHLTLTVSVLVLVRYSIYQSIAILVNVRYRYLVVSRYFDISNESIAGFTPTQYNGLAIYRL